MVHYKSEASGHLLGPDSYWKLDGNTFKSIAEIKTFLADKGYHCRAKIDKASALDAFGRYQRGLLSYRRYNLGTLRNFCAARGVLGAASGLKSRAALASFLEDADDNAKFEKLFDLPPEIRDMIYDFHFVSFNTLPSSHCQPPLTRASRQLRRETLAAFYQRTAFPLRLGHTLAFLSYRETRSSLKICPQTLAMMNGMTDQNFGFVRRLRTPLEVFRRSTYYHFEVEVTLLRNSPEAAVLVQYTIKRPSKSVAMQECYRNEIEAALIKMLNDMKPLTRGFLLQKGFVNDYQEAILQGICSAEVITGDA